ncbi:MAG: SDR family oxidoreductase [Ilumatobacteraceae bacterium]
MNRWVMTLASELGRDGITANVVVPGFVPDTELYGPDGADDVYRSRVLPSVAVGRLGTPDDVGALVRFLASPDAGWISGQCYDIDGGTRLPG